MALIEEVAPGLPIVKCHVSCIFNVTLNNTELWRTNIEDIQNIMRVSENIFASLIAEKPWNLKAPSDVLSTQECI